MDEAKERLRESLRDKDYREQYADSTLMGDISAQVQALRRQRGLSQEDLAKRIGSKQPKISNVETPPGNDVPNWEIGTLNRIAHALGTRLQVRFETYGSLLDEFGAVTTDYLRRPDAEDDAALFPKPPMPEPDPAAPERTRWMQGLMIPWLWEDRLDIPRLIGWLRGQGLPPVGHEEEPYHWLLRGIAVKGTARNYLERRFAERLAIVLGEQPDVSPLVADDPEEFLLNLYWTCAGIERPGFLAEQLWRSYTRLKGSKLNGAVRDALQGALMHNPFGETKPLKELWAPMVEKGRHYWLRGDEMVGYEAILIRHRSVKSDIETVFWALGKISKLWTNASGDRSVRFKRLIETTPELADPNAVSQMIDYAVSSGGGWAEWARELVKVVEEPVAAAAAAGGSRAHLTLKMRQGPLVVRAEWKPGHLVKGGLFFEDNELPLFTDQWIVSREPNRVVFLNAVATDLGNARDERPELGFSAKMLHAKMLHLMRETRQQVSPSS